jgi:hypothetical protein
MNLKLYILSGTRHDEIGMREQKTECRPATTLPVLTIQMLMNSFLLSECKLLARLGNCVNPTATFPHGQHSPGKME